MMKKLVTVSAAALVVLGLGACSEGDDRTRGTQPVVPPAPAAPADPGVPAPGEHPGVPAPGVTVPEVPGLEGLDELEEQLAELEELLGSGGTGSGTASSGATSYGDDASLDALWDSCEAGDMAACDDLYFASPIGSEYEAFGDSCGNRGVPEGNVFCEW